MRQKPEAGGTWVHAHIEDRPRATASRATGRLVKVLVAIQHHPVWPAMSDSEAMNEGEDEVPFTPEQIQWIDRLIASRAMPRSTSTSATLSSGGSRNVVGAPKTIAEGVNSASGALTTAASQPGELDNNTL